MKYINFEKYYKMKNKIFRKFLVKKYDKAKYDEEIEKFEKKFRIDRRR